MSESEELEDILYREELYIQPDGWHSELVVGDAVAAIRAAGYRKTSTAAELRRIADEYLEIAYDIGDSEPATDRDQRQQTAFMYAYRSVADRLCARASQLEADRG